MPNHITNVLRISSFAEGTSQGLIDEILASVRGETAFDFDKLIPRPKELDVTSGSDASNALVLHDDQAATAMLHWSWVVAAGVVDITGLRDLLRRQYIERHTKQPDFPTLDDFAARLRANIDQYAQADWYGWSIEHWGTKWNAYEVVAGKIDDREAVVHFETAWAPPLPVLDALAARFPKANLRLIWCDEGDDQQHRVYWEDGKRESEDA